MEKLKSLLTSKKFWTLVAAIVAALTAFFTTSCAAQAKIRREGIHIDTVRVDYIIRSKNFQTLASCSINQSSPIFRNSTRKFFPSTLAFATSTESALTMRSSTVLFDGLSILPIPELCAFRSFLNPFSSMRSVISTTSIPNCSESVLFSSRPMSLTSGEKCLIAFVPIAFVRRSRRRGGRKGRPRPSTKTVPLGGSHL